MEIKILIWAGGLFLRARGLVFSQNSMILAKEWLVGCRKLNFKICILSPTPTTYQPTFRDNCDSLSSLNFAVFFIVSTVTPLFSSKLPCNTHNCIGHLGTKIWNFPVWNHEYAEVFQYAEVMYYALVMQYTLVMQYAEVIQYAEVM